MKEYYCVSQYDKHAHEHRWVFTEEQYKELCERNGVTADGTLSGIYNGNDCNAVEMAGISSTLKGIIHDWLLSTDCLEVDVSDPSPKDLAEYYCTIDTDYGCAGDFVTAQELKSFNKDTHDRRLDNLINLGLGNYLHSDKWGDMRYSEIMEIAGNDLRRERLIGILEGKSLYSGMDIRSLTLDGFKEKVDIKAEENIPGYDNRHVGNDIYGITMKEFLERVYDSNYSHDEEPFYAYETDLGDGLTAVHFDTKHDEGEFYAGLFPDNLVLIRDGDGWGYNYFRFLNSENTDTKDIHSVLKYDVNPDTFDRDGHIADGHIYYDCEVTITFTVNGVKVKEYTGDNLCENIESFCNCCDEVVYEGCAEYEYGCVPEDLEENKDDYEK